MKKKAIFILPMLLLSSCSGQYDFKRATSFMAIAGLGALKYEHSDDSPNFQKYASYAKEIYKQSEESSTPVDDSIEFKKGAKFLIHFSFYPSNKERVVSFYFFPQNEIVYIYDVGNYGQPDRPTRVSEDKEQKYYLALSEIHTSYLNSKA